jgi:hypothetical protein
VVKVKERILEGVDEYDSKRGQTELPGLRPDLSERRGDTDFKRIRYPEQRDRITLLYYSLMEWSGSWYLRFGGVLAG